MKIRSGFLAIFFVAMIYGFFGVVVRFSSEAFGAYTQTVLRGVVAVIAAALIAKFSRSNLSIGLKPLLLVALQGTVFLISTIAFTYAVETVKISVAVFMIYVGSMTTSFFLGIFFFKEKINLTSIVSLLVVILGLLFTVQFNLTGLSIGALLGILCGVTDSFNNGLAKYLGNENKNTVSFYKFLFLSLVGLLGIFLIGETPFLVISPLAVAATVVFGLSLILVNNLLMIGFKKFDISLGQVVLSSEIFFSIFFGIIFFAEMPVWYELIGAVLIFSGASIANFDLDKIWQKIIKK